MRWKHRVLRPGLPEKSLSLILNAIDSSLSFTQQSANLIDSTVTDYQFSQAPSLLSWSRQKHVENVKWVANLFIEKGRTRKKGRNLKRLFYK